MGGSDWNSKKNQVSDHRMIHFVRGFRKQTLRCTDGHSFDHVDFA
ncbi:hypothetical protein [Paenibacillus sp. 19GGS1-52]|nr:hypothetical protein [Paenibacillus sp. 19GGS1-52]